MASDFFTRTQFDSSLPLVHRNNVLRFDGASSHFHMSIYNITRYVAEACPSVFRLVHEHWFLCVRNRFLWQVGIYGGVLVAYLLLSRLVWPTSSVSVQELAEWNPAILLAQSRDDWHHDHR